MMTILAALSLVACTADVRQAEAFLHLLDVCGPKACDQNAIDDYVQLHGTRLVIAQQNVSRTVTAAEYRQAVDAALTGATPDLAAAADATPRARRGIEGLLNDVVPGIRWAVQHRELLRQRLERLRALDLCAARQRAERYVPVRSEAQASLFVVMGGRAGAAAIGNDIYFDVLATSYRGHYPSEEEIVDYFAHEVHHLLYGGTLQAERAKLSQLSEGRAVAYDVLESLLMEGSATYFVNFHRDLTRMNRDPAFRNEAGRVDAILASLDDVLTRAVSENVSRTELDAAMSAFTGNAFHAAGATMLAEIDRAFGYAAVRRVMLQPRLLLFTYNRAAARRRAHAKHLFRPGTASAVMKIGRR